MGFLASEPGVRRCDDRATRQFPTELGRSALVRLAQNGDGGANDLLGGSHRQGSANGGDRRRFGRVPAGGARPLRASRSGYDARCFATASSASASTSTTAGNTDTTVEDDGGATVPVGVGDEAVKQLELGTIIVRVGEIGVVITVVPSPTEAALVQLARTAVGKV